MGTFQLTLDEKETRVLQNAGVGKDDINAINSVLSNMVESDKTFDHAGLRPEQDLETYGVARFENDAKKTAKDMAIVFIEPVEQVLKEQPQKKQIGIKKELKSIFLRRLEDINILISSSRNELITKRRLAKISNNDDKDMTAKIETDLNNLTLAKHICINIFDNTFEHKVKTEEREISDAEIDIIKSISKGLIIYPMQYDSKGLHYETNEGLVELNKRFETGTTDFGRDISIYYGIEDIDIDAKRLTDEHRKYLHNLEESKESILDYVDKRIESTKKTIEEYRTALPNIKREGLQIIYNESIKNMENNISELQKVKTNVKNMIDNEFVSFFGLEKGIPPGETLESIVDKALTPPPIIEGKTENEVAFSFDLEKNEMRIEVDVDKGTGNLESLLITAVEEYATLSGYDIDRKEARRLIYNSDAFSKENLSKYKMVCEGDTRDIVDPDMIRGEEIVIDGDFISACISKNEDRVDIAQKNRNEENQNQQGQATSDIVQNRENIIPMR